MTASAAPSARRPAVRSSGSAGTSPGRLVRRGRPPAVSEPLDPLDVAILAALQADGRASLRRVAKSVGASVTTVSTRVRGLERLGVLQGFVPLVSVQRLAAVGRSPHCAVLFVAPRNRSRDGLAEVAREVAQLPSVCYLFELAGSSELIAFASTVHETATDELVRSIERIGGVRAVRPIYIARVHKERPGHPVGRPADGPSAASVSPGS